MRAFLKQVPVTVKAIDNGFIFDIIVTLQQGSDSAVVRICQYHTNIVLIQRNSEVLLDHTAQETKQLCGDAAPAESGLTDRALLNIADIFAFADTCEINDIRPLLETQIRYNTRISEEGLRGDYGANIGSTMLKFYGEDVRNRAIAKAAAGSDARMSGCELPVVIQTDVGVVQPCHSSTSPMIAGVMSPYGIATATMAPALNCFRDLIPGSGGKLPSALPKRSMTVSLYSYQLDTMCPL